MIGLFDSGVGGLSVLTQVRSLSPTADLFYVADQAWAPYGERSLDQVRDRTARVTEAFIARGAPVVVLACNTASAAALHWLRRRYAGTHFVGMEPAVKPAANITKTGIVGVLATTATFQGELFASVVDRFSDGVEVIAQACPGLADLVEHGIDRGPAAEELLAKYLEPIVAGGADTIVLGCTHYHFLTTLIRSLVGPEVQIIDPSPAVARQTVKVASEVEATGIDSVTELATTGDPHEFERVATHLAGLTMPVGVLPLPT